MRRSNLLLVGLIIAALSVYACGGGGGGETPTGGTTDTEAPGVPTGLAATASSAAMINLTWNASADNVGISGYEIYRDGGAVNTTTTAAYADTSLAALTNYCYTLLAYDAAGNKSAQTSPQCATTLDANAMVPAAGTWTGFADDDQSMTVNFTVSSDGQALIANNDGTFFSHAYEACPYGNKIQSHYLSPSLAISNNSFSRPSAFSGTFSDSTHCSGTVNVSGQMFYYDSALQTNRNCTYATTYTWTATPGTTPPTPPAGLAATATSSSLISLAWTASTDDVGVSGYKIYRNGSLLTTTTDISYGDSGLAAATPYCYQVAAYDAAGYDSVKSDETCATTLSRSTFKLPDSGQTTSYTDTTGEDADYAINPPSYTDNGNGTVTDNNTGIIWQKEKNAAKPWAEAGTDCDELTLAGYSDWRLPDIFTLMTIVNYEKDYPALDTTYFPGTTTIWSSTTDMTNSTEEAWVMDYYDPGRPYSGWQSSAYSSRCVRGTQLNLGDFVDNSNGTITDYSTSLLWQKEDDGTPKTWESALSYCEGLALGGHSDWRLPNERELYSITNTERSNPSIDTSYFPNTQSSMFSVLFYWASTTAKSNSANAWHVNFSNSNVWTSSKTSEGYVRCVRGGVGSN